MKHKKIIIEQIQKYNSTSLLLKDINNDEYILDYKKIIQKEKANKINKQRWEKAFKSGVFFAPTLFNGIIEFGGWMEIFPEELYKYIEKK